MQQIRSVGQHDRYGCVIACLATVLRRSYEDVKADIGDPGTGLTEAVWSEYLSREGYAVQHLYRFDQMTRLERRIWPLKPWAPVHLCLVDAGGPGGHLVVMLSDGAVLDPAQAGRSGSLTNYPSVMAMTGVFDVSRSPGQMIGRFSPPAPKRAVPIEDDIAAVRAALSEAEATSDGRDGSVVMLKDTLDGLLAEQRGDA